MIDTGYWFLNGKVVSHATKERAWEKHHEEWGRLWRKKQRLEDRHRAEMAKVEAELEAHNAQEPFTPWLGHKVRGVIPSFLKQAKRDWEIKKKERDGAKRA